MTVCCHRYPPDLLVVRAARDASLRDLADAVRAAALRHGGARLRLVIDLRTATVSASSEEQRRFAQYLGRERALHPRWAIVAGDPRGRSLARMLAVYASVWAQSPGTFERLADARRWVRSEADAPTAPEPLVNAPVLQRPRSPVIAAG